MPVIRKPTENYFNAMQVLYSRCTLCEYFLTWMKHQEKEVFYATCCGFVYRSSPIDNKNHLFRVSYYEADLTNVTLFPRIETVPPPAG